jgi:hypothetical protein
MTKNVARRRQQRVIHPCGGVVFIFRAFAVTLVVRSGPIIGNSCTSPKPVFFSISAWHKYVDFEKAFRGFLDTPKVRTLPTGVKFPTE